MYLPNCKIQFSGFKPTSQLRAEIGLIIQALQSRAPSDSSIRLSLVNDNDRLNGKITITSSNLQLTVKDIDQDAQSVMEKLRENVIEQLDHWVSERKFCA